MAFSLSWFKWHAQRIWSNLTVYQLIGGLTLLWLAGMWAYVLPLYYQRMNALRVENDRLVTFIERYKYVADRPQQPASPVVEAELSSLSYAALLALSAKHELSLADYREVGTRLQKQYQVTVKGSWLNNRLWLGELQSETFSHMEILSLDIQRDRTTNLVSLSLVLSEPVHAAP